MAERSGQILEYNSANKQGMIKPDDGGPPVRFYLRNLGDPAAEPKPGFKVSFDAPAARMNKKREQVQDPASSVAITDTSTVFAPKRQESRGGDGRDRRGRDRRGSRPGGGPGGDRRGRSPDRRDGGERRPRRERPAGERPQRPERSLTQPLFSTGPDATPAARSPQRPARPRRPRTVRDRGRDAGLQVEIKGQEKTAAAPRKPSPERSTRPSGRYLPSVARDVRSLLGPLSSGAISPSLLFDKYPRCSLAKRRSRGSQPQERSFSERSKREFLETSFQNAYRYCWGNRNAWHAIYHRNVILYKSLETAGYKVLCLAFTNVTRFMTGHCSPGVLGESGLSLQRTYGYPVIPASVIKGILRNHAALEASSVTLTGEEIESIFGTPQQAGRVIFFDALPTSPPGIEVDLTNNHYSLWYEGRDFPADNQNPHPSHFLVIKPGGQFVFGLALERGAEPGLLEKTGALMKAALSEQGLGAKTSLGYGVWQS